MIILQILLIWFLISIPASLIIGMLLSRNSNKYEESIPLDNFYAAEQHNYEDQSAA